jgi:hypothetical protein
MASIVSAGTTSATALNMSADTTGVLQLASNNGTVALTIATTQFVNIGTASSSFPLQISTNPASSSNPMLAINPVTGTNASYIYFNNSGAGGFNVGRSDSAGAGSGLTLTAYDSFVATTGTTGISFNTNNTRAMYLDSGQNLNIGTTNAVTGYKLMVNGAVYQYQTANGTSAAPVVSGGYVLGPADATIYAGMRFLNAYLSSNATQVAFYVTAASGSAFEAGRFTASGNFLVGTSNSTVNTYAQVNHATGSASGASFFVSSYNGTQIGDIAQSGTTAVVYNTTSDYRLKENIQPFSNALQRIAALKPCTYTWKASPEEVGEGFIAHELAEVCPLAVTGKKDAVDEDGNPKYQGIDTSVLVATLTAAIQELSAKVTALEEQVLNLGVK